MAEALHAGDTFAATWDVGADLTGATAQLILRRRRMGVLLASRTITASLEVTAGVTTVSAVLPADLATGDYAVTVRFLKSGEIVTTPSGGSTSLTIWP